MAHFAGLDVSVAETSICIVDEHGKIARERKVPTEPEEIIAALNGSGQACERIGLEAGPLSQWLYGELAEAGLPVICIETRHIRAVLAAQVKQDGPQRCARHRPDDAGWPVPPSARQDPAEPAATDAAHNAQAIAK
jgi:transposase